MLVDAMDCAPRSFRRQRGGVSGLAMRRDGGNAGGNTRADVAELN